MRIPEGKYVVGVSGGVDSMVLLDILAKQAISSRLTANGSTSPLELVVAHFNHGIRPDSDKDEEFVRQKAKGYQLPFEASHGNLGPKASEEKARNARYKFLNDVKGRYQARAIVTAHHQDDLMETAIINLLRGTGRRGLTAITENPDIIRPLLHLSKKDILAYAKKNRLEWREDPTNKDERYLRNFVRLRIIPKLSQSQRQQLLQKIQDLGLTSRTINQKIENLSQKIVKGKSIDRGAFIALPTEVANEVLMYFLRQNNIRTFDKKTVNRLVMAIKTARPGTKHEVTSSIKIEVTKSSALLQ